MASSPSLIQRTTINRLYIGLPLGFAMLAGMQLDLFSALKDEPHTSEQLAETLKVDVIKLRQLLYALVLAGLLSVEDGRFANGPEAAEYLVQGQPAYMGNSHALWSAQCTWMRTTAESIRTGSAQSKIDYDTMPADQLEVILRNLTPAAIADGRALAAQFNFSRVRTVADIGGGSGGLVRALIETQPGLHATVIDLPHVAAITQRIIAEAGVSERIEVRAANAARESLPGMYDAVVMRYVLNVLPAEDARQVVLNAGKVVKAGGAIYCIGAVLDDTRLSPPMEVAANVLYLNVFDHGQTYTEQEQRDWLTEAGFVDIRRESLPRTDIMTARKQV